MELELDLFETVAIGSFNPAIITPDWLHEVNICQPGSGATEAAYLDLTDTAGFVAGGFTWQVDFTRLVVGTQKPDADCGGVVAKVLQELPHTPIEAVGHNFHFSCSRASWRGVQPHLGGRSLADLRAEEVRWDGRFTTPDGWAEVTLRLPAAEDDFVAVVFNHHHLIDGPGAKQRTAAAVAAAGRFAADRKATEAMLKDLFDIG